MSRSMTPTAIVTGASSGIGRAIARTLAKERFDVFLTGRHIDHLRETARVVRDEGGQVFLEAFDVRESNRLQLFISAAGKTAGRLDVFVNVAGVGYFENIVDGDPAKWREMFEVNVLAMLVGCQAAIRAMRTTRSRGHIVSISSCAGRMDASHVYGATKAAVDSICTTMRKELEEDTIRVVNIVPGLVATNFFRNLDPDFVNSVLRAFGFPGKYSAGDVLSDLLLSELYSRASAVFASPEDIARAVIYAVKQPPDLNVSEIVVGPRKELLQVNIASTRQFPNEERGIRSGVAPK